MLFTSQKGRISDKFYTENTDYVGLALGIQKNNPTSGPTAQEYRDTCGLYATCKIEYGNMKIELSCGDALWSNSENRPTDTKAKLEQLTRGNVMKRQVNLYLSFF